MKSFTWKTRHGDYPGCSFVARYYHNPGNKELEVYDNEGCVGIITVNTEVVLDRNEILVKNYSEGIDNPYNLIRLGIINKFPSCYVKPGFVNIPVYKLTEKGMKLWDDK